MHKLVRSTLLACIQVELTSIAYRTLLTPSFVPFFALLASAMWAVNPNDLDTIRSVINSLEMGWDLSSFGASRLLRTSKPLYTTACRYIEVKSRATSTANAVSFKDLHQEMAPTAVPASWENLSALKTLDQFVFPAYALNITGDQQGAIDSTVIANMYSTSPSGASPGLSVDSGKRGDPVHDYSRAATSMKASQLGEWFLQEPLHGGLPGES